MAVIVGQPCRNGLAIASDSQGAVPLSDIRWKMYLGVAGGFHTSCAGVAVE
jgi:hypothetical protein